MEGSITRFHLPKPLPLAGARIAAGGAGVPAASTPADAKASPVGKRPASLVAPAAPGPVAGLQLRRVALPHPALLASPMGGLTAAGLTLGRACFAPALSRLLAAPAPCLRPGLPLHQRLRRLVPVKSIRPIANAEESDDDDSPRITTLADLRRLIRDLRQGNKHLGTDQQALAIGRLARVASSPCWLQQQGGTRDLPAAIELLAFEIEQLCGGARANKDSLKEALLTLAAFLPDQEHDLRRAQAIARRLLQSVRIHADADRAQALRDRADFLLILQDQPYFRAQPVPMHVGEACQPYTQFVAEQAWVCLQRRLDTAQQTHHGRGDAQARRGTRTRSHATTNKAEVLRALGLTAASDLALQVRRALHPPNQPARPAREQIDYLDAIRRHLEVRKDLRGGAFLEGVASPHEVARLLASLDKRAVRTNKERHLLSAQITQMPRMCQLRTTPALLAVADEALARLWQQAGPRAAGLEASLEGGPAMAPHLALDHYRAQLRSNTRLRLTPNHALPSLGVHMALHLPWLSPSR